MRSSIQVLKKRASENAYITMASGEHHRDTEGSIAEGSSSAEWKGKTRQGRDGIGFDIVPSVLQGGTALLLARSCKRYQARNMKLNWWSLIFPSIKPVQVHGRVTYRVHHNYSTCGRRERMVLAF